MLRSVFLFVFNRQKQPQVYHFELAEQKQVTIVLK